MVVVLPTYNECENLPIMVETLFSLGIPGLEILVVDDNSPDGTGDLAEDLRELHPDTIHVAHRPQKMGLGPAYIDGFGRALALGADYVVEMDADFQHDPQMLHEFRRWIEEYDVVVGSRYIPGGSVDDRWSFSRKFLSRGGSIYSRFDPRPADPRPDRRLQVLPRQRPARARPQPHPLQRLHLPDRDELRLPAGRAAHQGGADPLRGPRAGHLEDVDAHRPRGDLARLANQAPLLSWLCGVGRPPPAQCWEEPAASVASAIAIPRRP